MTNHEHITNIEQLNDLMFDIIEINNVIANSYENKFISESEHIMLINFKAKLLSLLTTVDDVLNGVHRSA